MLITIIVALAGIISLLIIHEFGHFIIAKKCGVEVEEFGVGYPPRIHGKRFGETIYSLNLIPFGAFVKIKGETGGVEDYRSFAGKPMWQRVSIVLGGVVSFWVISAIILGIVAGVWGLPTAVGDEERADLIDPMVYVIGAIEDSPAGKAQLKAGDVIEEIKVSDSRFPISKVGEVQLLTEEHGGKEIILVVKRGEETLELTVVPRISPPEGEGALGISLTRVALKKYPWYKAPLQGVVGSYFLTANVVSGWVLGIKSLLGTAELPPGVNFELMGPLGIFDLLREYFARGINYFLYLISLIAVALALANILPIPALDGGKLVFLGIEAVRRKPISPKLEQNITGTFFVLLIVFMLYITLKFDLPRFFS